jgi:hypothetical protein
MFFNFNMLYEKKDEKFRPGFSRSGLRQPPPPPGFPEK